MEEQKEELSERELEILRLVATGAANKEIARLLAISPNTVKVHLRNIFSKIGVVSRTEATLYAIHNGLVSTASTNAAGELSQEIQREVQSLDGLHGIDATVVVEDILAKSPAPTGRWQVGLGVIILLALAVFFLVRMHIAHQSSTPSIPVVQAQATIPTSQRWLIKSSMPEPRKGMGFIGYNDSFYLVGGETSQGIDGALLLYKPESNTWKTLKSKPTPVTDVHAALLGEKIYIPGGLLKNNTPTDVLEIYDPRQDSWETKAPLPVPLSAYALASFEGRLYLFGGKNGDTYVSSVYSYDPEEDRWEEHSPLGTPRAYAGAAVLNNRILVIGGYNGQHALGDNLAYFPNRDTDHENAWESYQPLPAERYAMGVTQLADFIFVFGGLGEDGNIASTLLQFTVPNNQWIEIDSPPAAVGAYPATLASGNYIYLCGGETPDGLLATNQAYQAIYTIPLPIFGN